MVWERASHLPQNHRGQSFLCFNLFSQVNFRSLQVTVLSLVHRGWPAAVLVARNRASGVFSSTPLFRRAGICVAEAFPSRAQGELTQAFGLRGTRAGQDRPGQTCPLPFALRSQRTVRERKRVL